MRREAGIINIPPNLTREIYEFVVSVIATDIVASLQKPKQIDEDVDKWLRKAIEVSQSFLKSLDTKGTRELYNEYESLRFVGQVASISLPTAKQSLFSGVANPARRAEIKDVFVPLFERVIKFCTEELVGVEDPKTARFKTLITQKVSLRGGSSSGVVASKTFEFKDEDWYPDLIARVPSGVPPFTFDVNVEKTDREAGGSWGGYRRVLTVIYSNYMTPQDLQREVWKVLVHEMGHVAQTMITRSRSMITEMPVSENLLSRKVRTPQYSQGGGLNDNYFLDDREFHTLLRDAIAHLVGHFKTRAITDQAQKMVIFKEFVGLPNSKEDMRKVPLQAITIINSSYHYRFFQSLKENAPDKWKKAVGDAYRIIFNSTPRLASASQALRSLEMRIARLESSR